MIRPIKASLVRRSVADKGFRPAEHCRRDHEMYFFYLDGRKTNIWVKLSHGARELRRDDIRNNARSVGVDGDDLYRILNCEHDAARTLAIARAAIESAS